MNTANISDAYILQSPFLNTQFFPFFRCDGESFCDIEVNSGMFGDPCPNTHKYVEVHYACSSNFGRVEGGTTTKKLPPWFLQGSAGSLWTSEAEVEPPSVTYNTQNKNNNANTETQEGSSGLLPSSPDDPSNSRVPQKPSPRKPILVAQDAVKTTAATVPSSGKDDVPRIPITTPKPNLVDMSESATTTIRVEKNTEFSDEANLGECYLAFFLEVSFRI